MASNSKTLGEYRYEALQSFLIRKIKINTTVKRGETSLPENRIASYQPQPWPEPDLDLLRIYRWAFFQDKRWIPYMPHLMPLIENFWLLAPINKQRRLGLRSFDLENQHLLEMSEWDLLGDWVLTLDLFLRAVAQGITVYALYDKPIDEIFRRVSQCKSVFDRLDHPVKEYFHNLHVGRSGQKITLETLKRPKKSGNFGKFTQKTENLGGEGEIFEEVAEIHVINPTLGPEALVGVRPNKDAIYLLSNVDHNIRNLLQQNMVASVIVSLDAN